MTIDAQDKQITMERHMQNIPPVLQNIRFFEPSGDLVDASRGFIEFADLLKRPLEAFKYLLTTVEKMSINLSSGYADLDLVMMASANEKHLDAFKASLIGHPLRGGLNSYESHIYSHPAKRAGSMKKM